MPVEDSVQLMSDQMEYTCINAYGNSGSALYHAKTICTFSHINGNGSRLISSPSSDLVFKVLISRGQTTEGKVEGFSYCRKITEKMSCSIMRRYKFTDAK